MINPADLALIEKRAAELAAAVRARELTMHGAECNLRGYAAGLASTREQEWILFEHALEHFHKGFEEF